MNLFGSPARNMGFQLLISQMDEQNESEIIPSLRETHEQFFVLRISALFHKSKKYSTVQLVSSISFSLTDYKNF